MQLAKLIMLKRSRSFLNVALSLIFLFAATTIFAQSNSPYSRYGLGDLFPNSNTTSRGMGGISAGYADIISVNFNNPASYAAFFAQKQKTSNKIDAGRVILDVGINLENRTLAAPNTPKNFTSSDAFFSYLQVGIPLRKNWGLSFGIRPLSRISYKINRTDKLFDPITSNYIDSAVTQFEGSGGSFLPTIGTGFAIGNLSAGFNVGYLFGKKDVSTRRAIIDTIQHYAANYNSTFSYGDVFFNAGLQYRIDLDAKKEKYLRLGLSGNWKQTIKGTQDVLRQTFINGTAGEILQVDSVFQQTGVKGQMIYPASYTAGFVVGNDVRGWLFGADLVKSKWSNFLLFGQKDSVQDSWKVQAGGQFVPTPGSNYFSKVTYRFGAFAGRDYVKVQQNLPLFGASFGLALPINRSRLAPNSYNAINLSFEYIKRGNNSNLLKENLFRFSVGFNLTDLWFVKRKYD